jgi:glyoxylase-like metal-dependent hydrolase (beta-lactamase superfamily II)
MNITTLRVGQMAANCYLLTDEKTGETLIVDPGDDAEYIMDKIASGHGVPQAIVATHGHFDHIMAARALELAYTIPCLMRPEDEFLVARMDETAKHFLGIRAVDPPPDVQPIGFMLAVGKSKIEVVYTPGHTPGSICLYSPKDKILLTGDTIFADGGVGRTDFSYSDPSKISASLKKILSYPADTALYPGHGEPTTVGTEKKLHRVV